MGICITNLCKLVGVIIFLDLTIVASLAHEYFVKAENKGNSNTLNKRIARRNEVYLVMLIGPDR